jgi:hypothetical protein
MSRYLARVLFGTRVTGHRRLTGSAFVVALIAAAAMTSAPSFGHAPSVAEVARPADSFVDSVGINTHLHYTGTVYDRAFYDVIRPKLVALGVRHVRDGAYTYAAAGPSTTYYRRCWSLAAAGIRFDLITTFRTKWTQATDYGKLGAVAGWCDGAVEAFEGVNEPDKQALPAGSPPWQTQTSASQKALFAAVRSNPALAHVAVLGPAVAHSPGAVGDLSAYVDYGNWHPYPGGRCPACADVYGQTVDTFLAKFRAPTGGKPLVASETGYHNAINASSAGQRAVSERAAGRYMPRLLFEYFNRGFARTYIYELIDEANDPRRAAMEANFGLLRNDGSEKPAYRAVQGLLGLLKDPGPGFSTSALRYSLSGQTDRVHHTLLQNRNGSFFFALWQERSSYDTGARPNAPDDVAARGDRVVPDQAVKISIQTPIAAAAVYRIDDSGALRSAPVALPNGSVDLAVSDRVTVVRLDPRIAPGAQRAPTSTR